MRGGGSAHIALVYFENDLENGAETRRLSRVNICEVDQYVKASSKRITLVGAVATGALVIRLYTSIRIVLKFFEKPCIYGYFFIYTF